MKEDIDWKAYGIEEAYAAYDAEQARKCIRQYAPEILLCDIEMPRENGITLMKWVREEKIETECIFLTCHASFAYAKEAISLGCQEYILLPADYDEIGRTVQKVADRVRQKKENMEFQKLGKQMIQKKIEPVVEQYGQKRKPEEIIRKIEEYVHSHLGEEDLTVNSIAEKIFLHPIYMNRLFKNEKKISIGQYIMKERMQRAAILLKDGKLSSYMIAEMLGYKSYSNFNLNFKKIYGCTPGQYAQEQKK